MTKNTAAFANTAATAATAAAAFALFSAWGICMLFNMYGTPKRVPPINAPAYPYEIKVYDNVRGPTDINSYIKLTCVV